MRAVIYTRYSSDQQRAASIEDQIRLARELVEHRGWALARVFEDRAQSGATSRRPAYQALLEGIRTRSFDIVVAEALDRLSRDQEDVSALYKRMRFAGIQLVTVAEGHIDELHVGLKGTMNALFLRDLAQKTHRGLRGRVETGHFGGGRCYGYAAVKATDATGNPLRGERRIVTEEAAVAVRIFKMFVAGSSPIAIARVLNAEGIPGPEGKAWRDTTIRGHAERGTGILRNELYIGRLVWNRMTFIKDPVTGKRVSRMNPKDRHIRQDVPELRIVEQDLWDQAQHRLGLIRQVSRADQRVAVPYWSKRRPHHLLTGKLFCGACGGAMSNVGRNYLACAAARRLEVCQNRLSIRRERLDQLILDALRDRLMQPEHVAAFTAEFIREWNKLQAGTASDRAVRERELQAVDRRLNGLIEAIADGLRSTGLQAQLDTLEARKAYLQRELAAAPDAAPALHPNLAGRYRAKVETLREALTGPEATEALEAARALIERVVLHPGAEGTLEIELIGEIAAMVELAAARNSDQSPRGGGADRDLFCRSVKVVAGTRNFLDLLLAG